MTETTEKNSWNYISLLLSYIIHPVFIPTYIFTVFLYFGNMVFEPYGITAQSYVVILIFITTAIIPLILLAINLFLLRKQITNKALLMDARKDRVIPFFYIGIYYSILTYMFFQYLNFPILLTSLMIIISACVLGTAVISLFWKISAHAISLGASLMIFVLINTIMPNEHLFYVIIGTLFISGITLASRLNLNAHTPEQIYVGYLVGIVLSGIGLSFLLPNLLAFNFNF
jgi:membrane-associated phospholipid phosphatase